MKINFQGIKDNMQHIAGIVVGAVVLRGTSTRFNKDDRNSKFFSTVAANLAADGTIEFFPYKMFY